MVEGPNFSDWKPLPMMPITASRISGADDPLKRWMSTDYAVREFNMATNDNHTAPESVKRVKSSKQILVIFHFSGGWTPQMHLEVAPVIRGLLSKMESFDDRS